LMARNKPLVFDAVDLGKQWASCGLVMAWYARCRSGPEV
jgi:hypothetical protein